MKTRPIKFALDIPIIASDIVPFFYYGHDSMALQFGKTVDPAVVNLRRFERLAGLGTRQ